ncbi:hypothetical protein [Gallionella capsiferriformans]|uniref:Uncharacterized protein n=1 Tax=Gallionella capsiferriformans (strain ES-2) TaxID=395494 RepID=D9SGP4_GALCS|nr:hypothetical protein [Gallionella capsiferriformans]ADL55691.1 hypothetical protein Galf_1679 [Gallionella capsiferriformans ES-2]
MMYESQLLYLLLALSAGHTAPTLPLHNKAVQLPAQPKKLHCREKINAAASRACQPANLSHTH